MLYTDDMVCDESKEDLRVVIGRFVVCNRCLKKNQVHMGGMP